MRPPAGFLFAAALFLFPALATAQEGFKVIAHPSNPATSIARDQLGRYFLKKATTWSNGRTVVPIDQVEGSPVREAFSRQVLRKTVFEVKAYWQQQIFSGRAVPPPVRPSDAQVVALVRENDAAIGYVAAEAATSGVKVLEIVD